MPSLKNLRRNYELFRKVKVAGHTKAYKCLELAAIKIQSIRNGRPKILVDYKIDGKTLLRGQSGKRCHPKDGDKALV